MKRRFKPFIALLVLVLVTLGCGLFSGTAEPTATPRPTKPPAEPTKPPVEPTSPPVEPTEKPEPTLPPRVELGEEYRSEEGGFAFRLIQGYEIETLDGLVRMRPPDADPDTGPVIALAGEVSEEAAKPEELYEEFAADTEGGGTEVSAPRPITVSGKPGMEGDISGSLGGQEIAGRLIVVTVTPNHHFAIGGLASADRWEDEVAPLFDAVLASVSFFPPTSGGAGGAETRQWAVDANASSEYDTTDWSAMQATGAPDTPECGDYETAWASSGSNTVEWIELEYDSPVLPTEVNIFQSYNPNQVVKVELRDLQGNYHTIYTGEPEEVGECPYVLSVPVEGADYQVEAVKITIDQSAFASWNEIDAVELVGVAERPGIQPGD